MAVLNSEGETVELPTARCKKTWRYDEDWLLRAYRAGWSCRDIAHYDNCAPGTVEYHLEQAGIEVDSWGPLCTRFRAEAERDREQGRRLRHAIEPKYEQDGLEDFL